MASASGGDKLDKELARFEKKGPLIKCIEHAVFDRDGRLVREGSCDTMEAEFRPYKLTGLSENFQTDPHAESCAQLRGSEDEFYALGKQARDDRLVITTSGQIARAIGSIADGAGYLLDQHGRPINRTPQAPVTPMKRKANDW